MAKTIGIIFGRFNPPHKGHKAAWEMASKCTYWYVGTNKSTHGPKDPLPYEVKIEAMKAIWPGIKDHIMPETSWLTMAAALFKKHGDLPLLCFTDEDWVVKTLKEYNGKEDAKGNYYNFSVIKQEKPPRLSSATALRKAVKEDDKEAFADAAGVDADTPITIKGKKVPFFDLVKKHLAQYTKEEVMGEEIVKTKKGDVDKIKAVFDDVLTEGDINWFFEEDLPKKYKSGLSDSTAKKRKYFWKKLGKYPFSKSDYDKADKVPGDSKKTKPSKYTTAYKEKFGEEIIEESPVDKALKNKSEKSGIPVGILRKVYNRGLAAWVTGHRPGASQAAWGMARVNSFILKGKTWKTTDADLAKKVRKEEVSEHIVKTKKGYVLYSKSKPKRKLGGPYSSKEQAIKKERQVQYFKHMGESKQKTFTELTEDINTANKEMYEVPTKVKETAKQGIDLVKEYKRGATPAAVQIARDLITKKELSLSKIKAIKAYFFRNKTQVQKGESGHRPSSNTIPSDEWISWQLYGGNAGRDWAEKILNPKKDTQINTDKENQ